MELVSRMMDGSIAYPPKDPPKLSIVVPPKVSQDRKIGYLQRVPILENCTKRQLSGISRITDVIETPPGEVLARAGEPGDRFFFIVDGAIRIDVSADRHHRMGPGEFFGEMSLLDGEPRSATAVADTPIRLLVIHRRDFWRLLKEVPALTEIILVTLSRRVRQAERAHTA
jgi:voltage-gated potassium channel